MSDPEKRLERALRQHPDGNFGGAAIADAPPMPADVAPLAVRERQIERQATTTAAAAGAAAVAASAPVMAAVEAIAVVDVAETTAPQEEHLTPNYEKLQRPSGRELADSEAQSASREATATGATSTPPRRSIQGGSGAQNRRAPAADARPASAAPDQTATSPVSYETT